MGIYIYGQTWKGTRILISNFFFGQIFTPYIAREKNKEGAKGTKEFFWKKWAQATTLSNNINLNTN
jgi:hypothetical protein